MKKATVIKTSQIELQMNIIISDIKKSTEKLNSRLDTNEESIK